jgi:hypothetical protein
VIFLFLAYIFKVNSIWNDSKPEYRKLDDCKVVIDVWNKKSTSDFLHYLKFEYMQTAYLGSSILISIFFERNLLNAIFGVKGYEHATEI